jgi:uncharacterized coiled-coil protein SlyX
MDYSLESRVARIESDVAHLCTQVTDIKTDLRSLRDKLDRLSDRMQKEFASLRESRSTAKVWGFGLALTIAGGLLGAMARGFGWI